MYENIFYNICSNASAVFNSLMNNTDGFKRINSDFTLFTVEERLLVYQANSIGIKLGDAIEAWVNQFVKDHGYNLLLRNATLDNGKCADFDFVYTINNEIWFAEIKIRDDHDSTKKIGQCDDYLNKVNYLNNHYPEYKIHSCIWFVDPTLSKNKNYYLNRLNEDEVLYGNQFNNFICIHDLFDKLTTSLNVYRHNKNNFKNTENINVNINEYSASKWVKFLTSNQQLIDYFYPQGVPYIDLLAYAQTMSKRQEVKQLISICKEHIK